MKPSDVDHLLREPLAGKWVVGITAGLSQVVMLI
jgi:hypothetical protein